MLTILTALTTVVTMRMVGVLLVSAMMVIPTLTGFAVGRSFRQARGVAMATALIAVVSGLALGRDWHDNSWWRAGLPQRLRDPVNWPMVYMIVETFRNRDAMPVYRRFRERGRLAPHGLRYVSSWVTSDMTKCYQVMECDDRRLLDEWTAQWSDLIDFEIIPVITSAEAVERVQPQL
jgi:hypothetical protein